MGGSRSPVPRPAPPARRLAALRTRTLLHREFGHTESARSVLTRLLDLLEQIDVDEEPEAKAEPAKGDTPKRARKQPAG